MIVIKRDGTEQEFDENKILVAIMSAMQKVNNGKSFSASHVKGNVVEIIQNLNPINGIGVEEIQDMVEAELMKKHPLVAKAYILYRNKRSELRMLAPDSKAISDYIHASKYAQYLPDRERRELYDETVERSKYMHMRKFPELTNDIATAFQFVHDKRVLPSMRSMQFGGKAIKAHNARMYNCSFTLVDRTRVFQEIFYLLLCGCGVGFSVQKQHVAKLPKIGKIDENKVLIHHVEDSIIGWADTIGLLFDCYEKNMYLEPCYNLIRPVGAKLRTGGGRAPGHIPLKKVIEKTRAILDKAVGRHLRPIECHDIICHIAEAVLAGGIRRSSLISLFSKDDEDMLNCKTPEHFNYEGKNNQRAMANNSVVFLRKDTTLLDFMDLIGLNRKTYGEPGFMFTNNLDHGTNPCGEIGIDPTTSHETGFGFCNLCEVNVAACKTEDEFFAACNAAAFIGTLQATYTDFPYLGQVTEDIVRRDALLGIGLVGIMDNPDIGLDPHILHAAALAVRVVNHNLAERIGINSAVRCTTVKPGGTSSLELGCIGSGIHPHHASRYFRRVTANVNEPIANYFMDHNPHMVEKKSNGDLCITFPIQSPKSAIILEDLDSIDFMDHIFKVYDSWILTGGDGELTHNISSTVVVEEMDWSRVLEYAWANRYKIRSMSFFPKFGDKQIPYAPREEVTVQDEAKWKFLIENYKIVDYSLMKEEEDQTDLTTESACGDGSCDTIHTDSISKADGSIFFTKIPDNKHYRQLYTPTRIGSLEAHQAFYGGL